MLLKYLVKTEGQDDVTIPRWNSSENHIYGLEISICTSYLRLLLWYVGRNRHFRSVHLTERGIYTVDQSTHFLSTAKNS